jgi:hypothetical protein
MLVVARSVQRPMLLDVSGRVDLAVRCAVAAADRATDRDADLEVKVRQVAPARIADRAEHLAAPHRLAGLDLDLLEVRVQRLDRSVAGAVHDADDVPPADAAVLREHHDPVGDRVHRIAPVAVPASDTVPVRPEVPVLAEPLRVVIPGTIRRADREIEPVGVALRYRRRRLAAARGDQDRDRHPPHLADNAGAGRVIPGPHPLVLSEARAARRVEGRHGAARPPFDSDPSGPRSGRTGVAYDRRVSAVDRNTLLAWRRASRWLLAGPLVIAIAAAGTAIADRPEPTVALARSAQSGRLEIELRILHAEVDLLKRELDRIDVIDRQPYYDGRPMRIEDIEPVVGSAERLEAFGQRTRGVHWSEFPEL